MGFPPLPGLIGLAARAAALASASVAPKVATSDAAIICLFIDKFPF